MSPRRQYLPPASGGFAPDPHRGSAPGTRWGASVPHPPHHLFCPLSKFLATPLVRICLHEHGRPFPQLWTRFSVTRRSVCGTDVNRSCVNRFCLAWRDYVQIYSIPAQNNREIGLRFVNNFATNTFSICKTAIANQQREKITLFVEVTIRAWHRIN